LEKANIMKTTLPAVLGVLLAATALRAADEPPKNPPGGAVPNAPAAEPAARSEDEKAIRATTDAFAQAFQKGDAKAIAALFTEDGEAIDAEGEATQGRAALEQHYAERLAAAPGDKIEAAVDAVKILAPGVARVTGHTQVTPSGGGPPLTGRFTAINVKRDGRWLLASVRELPDPEVGHYDHLKELEWLVGDWVEESADAVITSSVAWTDDKNFLFRSFAVRVKGKPELTGTQRIGWDPLTRQIKSWVFDARGGYGDGLWMRSGDQWVIKATGVRPDGRTATATQVLTYVNKDTLRWRSIDQTLGGDVSPDIDEVVMVRKPPQPK
jgi:uncharacterized protein (TIGR02246 family)